jgi:hypothetical protein
MGVFVRPELSAISNRLEFQTVLFDPIIAPLLHTALH